MELRKRLEIQIAKSLVKCIITLAATQYIKHRQLLEIKELQ